MQHKHKLANNNGDAKLTMFTRNFNSCRSQVRKRRTIGLNQSLIYMHILSPTFTSIFLVAPLQLSSQENYSYIDEILEGHLSPPLPPSSKLCLYHKEVTGNLNTATIGVAAIVN
jgi:hypothetical protein